MSGYLVDTCALSEFQKPSPDLGVVSWFAQTDLASLYLSVVTVGELRYGISLQKNAKKREFLERWFTADLLFDFADRILPIDADCADLWGRIRARATLDGRPIPVADAFIAATALHRNLIVLTRNTEDFSSSGVPVLNPWSGA